MNKKIIMLIICLCFVLTACGNQDFFEQYKRVASGSAIDRKGKKPVEQKEFSDAKTATSSAVMGEVASGSGIHAADNVSTDMQTAQYWIDRMTTPDRVIMDTGAILAYNQEIKKQMSQDSSAEYYDLDSFGENISGLMLREMMGNVSFSLKTYFSGERQISAKDWQQYYENCNYDAIADINAVQYGIICERADIRMLPTDDIVTDEPGKTYDDDLQCTALAVNEPVLVLYGSRDGKWCYVMAEEYVGWTHREAIGFCRSREEWSQAAKMDKFLVVTGDRIQTKQIPGNPLSGDYEFTMGTKLCLAENKEWKEDVEIYMPYDNYVVKVPVRDASGTLSYSLLAIPLHEDVSVGYMDYTRANIIRQAFKMLGNPYGWGGECGERDCSAMVRDIFLCFGFRLPRNSGDIAKLPGKNNAALEGMSEKEVMEKMKGAEPGAILQMPGHVMLYLGCQDKNYFVISARGSAMRRVMINDLHAATSDGKTWSEQLAAIVNLN